VRTADGQLVVLAGAEVEVIDETLNGLIQLFVLAVPIFGLLVGGVTFFIAGRVLEPVEQIRAQAEGIGAETLGARVPVPDSGDEIHDLAVTMNSMLDRLEAHEQSQRQFSADASHELKSPIANVRALVDTTELDDPEWSRLRTRLAGETDRLRDLVDNPLFLATTSGGRRRKPPTTVNLDDLIFDEAELLASTTDVAVDLSGIQPVQVLGDRADLQRLVRNLADNAARHARTRVYFSSSMGAAGNESVELRVADDGDGIAESDRSLVFERFTRLDEARARDDGGSGLGLSIVRQIVDDHGGTILIEALDMGGAEFVVELPAPDRL
jgi:signal transduction histidine kinase